MTTTLTIQERLIALGFYVGPKGADGEYGPGTIGGILAAISELERLMDKLPEPTPPAAQTTSAAGRKAITDREGNVLTAYQDSVGIWTIGVGHTSAAGLPKVAKGLKITAAESDEILSRDLKTFEAGVRAAVNVPLNQNEFDALVSLAFNIGVGAFSKSTLVKKLNTGDRAGAADQFGQWVKAGGKTLKGLVTRRQSERKQFLS